MYFDWHEWTNLILRWVHVIAGFMWIGQTYLFNKLENSFTMEGVDKPNISGRMWMVHGGGFFLVEKQSKPEIMPGKLHWFKYESLMTWLSGFFLFVVVYYMGGLLITDESPLSETNAILLSLAFFVVGFGIYNLIWYTPIGKNEFVGTLISFLTILAATCFLGTVFSTRATYMHIGGLFGTIMAANVWMRILPAQRNMIAAVTAGKSPDMTLADKAKRCSKHNTYMSVPLIFIMISNHFPSATYGNDYSWQVLGVLILAGWVAAKILRGKPAIAPSSQGH